jgi:hypothetical protein
MQKIIRAPTQGPATPSDATLRSVQKSQLGINHQCVNVTMHDDSTWIAAVAAATKQVFSARPFFGNLNE